MQQGASLLFYIMQRVLESDLLIGFGARILRNDHLHGLEIEEVERIAQLLHELTDSLAVDMRLVRQGASDLRLLEVGKFLVSKVVERYLTFII